MYDDDDREQYEYTCHAPSCGEAFYAASPEWFLKNTGHEPKFCPDCRAWFQVQEEIGTLSVSCYACGYSWGARAKYRISYHKRIGDWETDKDSFLCWRCEKNPTWRFKRGNRLATARLKKMADAIDAELVENEFGDDVARALELVRANKASSKSSFEVPADVEFYEQSKNRGRRAKHGANQLKHILKAKHLWKKRLPSEDPRIIVELASEIASQTGEYIAEKKQANGNTMKCDARTGLVVIIKPDADSESGHSIETAFMAKKGAEEYLRTKLR